MREFLLQLFLYQPVAPVHHLADEAGVVINFIEITAAPQHESLVDGILQPVVGLLGDAVFVGFSGIDQRGLEPVVVQELGVAVVEGPAAAALYLVGQGRGVVGTDHPRRAAQGPQGVLESPLQGQEGLASGHLGVAPTRMAQHQLEQQVAVGSATDGDSQGVAVGEVDLGPPARWMLRGEVDPLIRTVERTPPEFVEGPAIGVAVCADGMR